MISYKLLPHPKNKKEMIERFDPHKQTWLVSDLHSKLEFQQKMLEKHHFLKEESILRASELWKKLLFRTQPSWRVVSQEYLGMKIQNFLKEQGVDDEALWEVSVKVLSYIKQLIPILIHEEGDEALRQWFKKNSLAQERWSYWYDLSQRVWSRLIKENLVSGSWVGGVLLGEMGFEKFWHQDLIVDLGGGVNEEDGELLQILARYVDVCVLVPLPSWAKPYESLLNPYSKMFSESFSVFLQKAQLSEVSTNEPSTTKPSTTKSYQCLRFPTMLGEVKQLVAQVHQWIREGVVPHRIAIVVPQPEVYWPVLEPFLEAEGIFCNKPRKIRYHSFKEIQQWISRLKLLTFSKPKSDDLETEIFSDSKLEITHEEFSQKFSFIYDRDDLKRNKKIEDGYQSEYTQDSLMDFKDFTKWALEQWDNEKSSFLPRKLWEDLTKECHFQDTFSLKKWIEYLEFKACKKEHEITPSALSGVRLLDLLSVDYEQFDKIFFCGLIDSQLKNKKKTAIFLKDISSLSESFGFNLVDEEVSVLEFQAQWAMENQPSEFILSTATNDFLGAIQNPSLIWLERAQQAGIDIHKVCIPKLTYWDFLQRQEGESIAQNLITKRTDSKSNEPKNKEAELLLWEGVQVDLGHKPWPLFPPNRKMKVSPSSLETYLEFPFLYAIRYLFYLSDFQPLDLDMDPLNRGKLMHALFERLTPKEMVYNYSDENLITIIEESRRAEKIFVADDRLWPSVQKKYVQLARRFLENEKKQREKFLELKTTGTEVLVEGFIYIGEKETDKEMGASEKSDREEIFTQDEPIGKKENWWPFRGRVDRIDQDGKGHTLIIDYKSSKGSLTSFKSWAKKQRLQLVLYAQAVEAGLAKEPQLKKIEEVEGALYYIAKDMSCSTGFKQEINSGHLFEIRSREGCKMKIKEKQELYQKINTLVFKAIDGIKRGDFRPESPKEKYKLDNKWKDICRQLEDI